MLKLDKKSSPEAILWPISSIFTAEAYKSDK